MAINVGVLRRRLEAERRHLTEQLKASVDAYDEASAENLRLMKQRLAAAEHALRKFEEGTYGLCDVCGQPIAPERLEAFPQANLCFSCKARRAKR